MFIDGRPIKSKKTKKSNKYVFTQFPTPQNKTHPKSQVKLLFTKAPKSRFPASVWRSADLCKQTQDGSDQQEGDVGLQEILKPMTVPTDGVVI